MSRRLRRSLLSSARPLAAAFFAWLAIGSNLAAAADLVQQIARSAIDIVALQQRFFGAERPVAAL